MTPDEIPPPEPEVAREPAAPARWPRAAKWGSIAALLVALLALAATQMLWQRLGRLQEQLARQAAEATKTAVDARTLAQHTDTLAQNLNAKQALLDQRVGDLLAYRSKLEGLVQAILRARDENVVVEIEAALRFAQDQSQLTGSLRPLLAALRTAERRLEQSVDPRLFAVSQAVARDLERLKSAREPDTAGLLARIEQVLREVDGLPIDLDARGDRGAEPTADAAPVRPWWARWRAAVGGGVCRVFGCSAAANPGLDALRPDQALLIRENLRLRLEGARLGLLARQYGSARSDLLESKRLVEAWFDPDSARTQAAAKTLGQLAGLAYAPDLPDIADTLAALSHVEARKTE